MIIKNAIQQTNYFQTLITGLMIGVGNTAYNLFNNNKTNSLLEYIKERSLHDNEYSSVYHDIQYSLSINNDSILNTVLSCGLNSSFNSISGLIGSYVYNITQDITIAGLSGAICNIGMRYMANLSFDIADIFFGMLAGQVGATIAIYNTDEYNNTLGDFEYDIISEYDYS